MTLYDIPNKILEDSENDLTNLVDQNESQDFVEHGFKQGNTLTQ